MPEEENIWQNTTFRDPEPPQPGIIGTFGGDFYGTQPPDSEETQGVGQQHSPSSLPTTRERL